MTMHAPARMSQPPSTDPEGSPQRGTPRVLMLAPDLRSEGGVASYVAMLMTELDGCVAWTHLIIARRPGASGRSTPLRLLRDWLRCARALLTGDHQIVHLNPSFMPRALPRDLIFLALAQSFGQTRQLVFFHGWDWATFRRVAASTAYRAVVVGLLRRAGNVIVLSGDFKRALADIGVPEERISVATTMFHRDAVPHPATQHLPLPLARFQLLFMARVVREKGIFECIEAIAMLRAQGREVRLLVAGDGPDMHGARAAAHVHGVASHVEMAGFLRGHTKLAALQTSHLFLLPTRHGEGCPVSLLEAMASGLPVITTAAGGIPAIVKEGVNGRILPDVTAAGIAAAVAGLLDDASAMAAMGLTNRAEAFARYEARPVAAGMFARYAILSKTE